MPRPWVVHVCRGPRGMILSEERLGDRAFTPAHSGERGRARPAQTQAIFGLVLFGEQPGQK